ncbi:aminopeptidase N-like, partial [Musca vetustissima]|uniref:aminopeptidase N-like n=1 Tax=Musca vetustissima TaxID=27455 RepID=UPI002AB77027
WHRVAAFNTRLPRAIKPDYYELKIITHLENAANLSFHGDVSMHFKVLVDTRNITLQVKNLAVNKASIQVTSFVDNEEMSLFAEHVEIIAELDLYVIHLDGSLVRDREYELFVEFAGNLNKAQRGYFYNAYKDAKTRKTRWISFTDFEPVHARSAFPCLDEPEYKAKFKIWLGHRKSLKALSNMPLETQIPLYGADGYVWSIFKESPPMSTYLVSYSINDFAYKELKADSSNVIFRTWAREEYFEQSIYALEIAPKILTYFERLFGIPFPLEKIDMVAIPKYSSSAMENWGLITFKESILLLESDSLFEWSKRLLINVMGHELAHQWFGNLVTMKWWNDAWLKEGFATYFQSLAMDYIMPGQGHKLESSILNAKITFQNDAEANSHSISNEVHTSEEIEKHFDSITYQKSAAVVRMLHLFMGSDAFLEGLQSYLAKHMYDHSNSEAAQCWWIPLTYTTSEELNFNDTTPKAWMTCDNSSHPIQMNNLTVAQNQCDVIYCARFGYNGYSLAFDVMEYLRREREIMPWLIALNAIGPDLSLLTQLPEHSGSIMAYMRYLLQPIYSYVGAVKEDSITSTKDLQLNDLKTLLIEYACRMGLEDCVHTSLTYFQQWKSQLNSLVENLIPDDWKGTTYCTALRYGNENDWNCLWEYFNNTHQQDIFILKSLGCTQNREILWNFLEIIFNDNLQMPTVFAQIAFQSVASNPAGTSLALKYLIENYSELQKNFNVPHLLSHVASFVFAPDDLSKLCNFMNTHPKLFENSEKHRQQIIDE